jgi:hypothetical protein
MPTLFRLRAVSLTWSMDMVVAASDEDAAIARARQVCDRPVSIEVTHRTMFADVLVVNYHAYSKPLSA